MLEIGGGHGVAATRVLERITAGHFVGVDRSAKMIGASRLRNAETVASGRARFVQGTILGLDDAVGGRCFDRIFAIRVAALSAARELTVVARHMRPTGAMVWAFDSPDEARTSRLAASATAAAAAASLDLSSTARARIDGALVTCLTFGSTVAPGPAH